MSRYCRVCGRKLKRSPGSIGPKCLQKLNGKKPKKSAKSKYLETLAKYDMYKGEEDGQEKDESAGEGLKG